MIKKLKAKLGANTHFLEIINGSAMTFVAKILATGFGLISSIIIAKYYGAEIVGVVALINSVMIVFGVIGLIGSDTAVLRLIPEYLEKYSIVHAYSVYKKIVTIVLITSIFCSIFLYIFSGFISEDIFNNKSMGILLGLTAPFIVIRALNELNTASLRGLHEIKLFAVAQLVPSVVTLGLLIITTYYYYNNNNPIYVIFASSTATALVSFLFIYKTFNNKILVVQKVFPTVSISELLILSLPMFLASSMYLIISQTDTIMLGMMRTETEVGIYSIVLKLALLTNIILQAINVTSAPKFSQLYHSEKIEDLKEVAQKSSQLTFWITFPIILLYIFGGSYFLSIFGKGFTTGYYALVFLVIGQFINAASGSVGYFLNMTGRQKVFRNIVFLGAVTNILLNLILIPLYGINGAAIASMFSVALWNIMAIVYIKRKFGFYISYFPLFFLWKRFVG